jgi:hypothetical protein
MSVLLLPVAAYFCRYPEDIETITRDEIFWGLWRLPWPAFSERLPPATGFLDMSSQPTPSASRRIVWSSVVTVISAAILIGAEVFGAAFAGGWALAILFGLSVTEAHILQAVLFAIGVFVMINFIRAAQRVEPFVRRA